MLSRLLQCDQCKVCGRQFIESYSPRGYAKEVKEECLTMYVNGNGFRAIERITKVNHNTVIRWVKQVSNQLPDINSNFQTPEVGQLDELETFIGKKNKIWVWAALDKRYSGIIEYGENLKSSRIDATPKSELNTPSL